MTLPVFLHHLCALAVLAPLTGVNAPGQSPAPTNDLPADYPGITVLINDHPAPGLLFLNPISSGPAPYSYLSMLRPDMLPALYNRRAGSVSDFKMQPNGLLTIFDNTSSCFYATDASFAVIDSFRCGHGYKTDGHDIQLTTDGHALLLGRDPRTIDMSNLVPGGNPSATVLGAVVQELDDAKNVLFEWKSLDHLSITGATHEDLTANVIDYVHANSLAIDSDGNILLSSRHLDEITKIDRSTGAIIWRLGGKNNQFTFLNDMGGFSHQHDARRISNGHLTVFDNGNFHTPQYSRAAEYALDEVHKTASLIWEYRHAPDIFARATGNVQRLPNGNTLISWGTENTVTEVRPDGTTALEVVLDSGFTMYRTFKFFFPLADIPRIAGRPEAPALLPAYPNPFNAVTSVTVRLLRAEFIHLAVYSALGEEVAPLRNGWQPAGEETLRFIPGDLASGVYFVRLSAGGRALTQRVAFIR